MVEWMMSFSGCPAIRRVAGTHPARHTSKEVNSKIKIGFALGSLLALAPVADAAASTPSFGICAHVSRDEFDIREREFEMMRDAGITRVRTDFDWATIEPRPGEWHFEKFDRLMDDAARFGIRILPVLGFDNPGAYPGTAREHLEEWCRYVRAVMERYGGSLDVVEVWNEPNLRSFWKPQPDAAQYAAFLKTTYETIKAVSPQTRVMMGGTAGADTAFIEGIYKAGGGPFMDIVNIHPYSWPNPPEGALAPAIGGVRAVMARHGDAAKPIWITEHGWPTHRLQFAGAQELRTGLAIAHPGRSAWRVALATLFDDSGDGADMAAKIAEILPNGSTIEAWGPARLAASLSTNAVDAVMLIGESFPLDALDAMRAFVADGGVLVSLGLVPLYYACRDGAVISDVDPNEVKRTFHLGWKAWWTDANLPQSLKVFATDEALAHGYKADPAGYEAERFFTDVHLAPGDRIVPLLVGRDKTGAPAVAAAVYLFDSDLKGALVVSALKGTNGGTTEADQARYILRSMEIAEEMGIEAYMIYEFQSPEDDPLYSEANFGIVHRDLSPKPAYDAIRRRNNPPPAIP